MEAGDEASRQSADKGNQADCKNVYGGGHFANQHGVECPSQRRGDQTEIPQKERGIKLSGTRVDHRDHAERGNQQGDHVFASDFFAENGGGKDEDKSGRSGGDEGAVRGGGEIGADKLKAE